MRQSTTLFVLIFILLLQYHSYSQYNTWEYKSAMPTARTFLSSTVLDNKLYVIGGCPTTNATNKVEVYDPSSDMWSSINNLPESRCYAMSCTYQNKIYVFGGGPGMWSNALDDVYEYDLQSRVWNPKSDMPYQIGGSGIAVVDNTIYIIGGAYNSTSQPVATVMAYDPASETWTQKADLPTARNMLSACVVDGKIYAIGGTTEDWENVFYKVVEMYDPSTNTWTQKSDMPTGRWGFVTCVVDELIYSIGGRAGTLSSAKNEVYNPVSDTWITKAPMQQSRTGLAGGTISSKIYVAGGHLGPPLVYLSSCEEYISDLSDLELNSDLLPENIKLLQNYPNPFNPSTKIKYTIPASTLNPFSKGEGTLVQLKVYDVLGNEVATLVNAEQQAGNYEVEFNPESSIRQLASGIYFYQLKVGDPWTGSGESFVQTKKMMLLK